MSKSFDRVKSTDDQYRILYFRIAKEQYKRLRRVIIKHEQDTGVRMSQQDVLNAALAAYLDQER